jgi:hypothetical protein
VNPVQGARVTTGREALMSSRLMLVCAVALGTVNPGCPSAWERPHAARAARGMALTTPWHGMAFTDQRQPNDVLQPERRPIINASHPTDLTPAYRHVRLSRGADPVLGGQLPNQQTGPKREHVVRDICIGC